MAYRCQKVLRKRFYNAIDVSGFFSDKTAHNHRGEKKTVSSTPTVCQ